MYRILFLLAVLAVSHTGYCQQPDTLPVPASTGQTDSISKSATGTTPSPITSLLKTEPFITPKKKAMFSAIFPGMGQIYNKQYWKLPIVYGGLGVAGYYLVKNTNDYNKYRKIYAGRLSGREEFFEMESQYNLEQIKIKQDEAREYRDLTVLFTVIGYGLQIVDALVFAHLKDFDISEDIAMQIRPTITPNLINVYRPSVGVGMVFKLR